MLEENTAPRARQDEASGKSPSTQAGEFVREEMHHIREGKHGAQSPQQAIAIGLSKARRTGVKLPPPRKSKTSARTRKQAQRDIRKGQRRASYRTSRTRSRAVSGARRREGHAAAARSSLSRYARAVARQRGVSSSRQSVKNAARTRRRSRMRQEFHRRSRHRTRS